MFWTILRVSFLNNFCEFSEFPSIFFYHWKNQIQPQSLFDAETFNIVVNKHTGSNALKSFMWLWSGRWPKGQKFTIFIKLMLSIGGTWDSRVKNIVVDWFGIREREQLIGGSGLYRFQCFLCESRFWFGGQLWNWRSSLVLGFDVAWWIIQEIVVPMLEISLLLHQYN